MTWVPPRVTVVADGRGWHRDGVAGRRRHADGQGSEVAPPRGGDQGVHQVEHGLLVARPGEIRDPGCFAGQPQEADDRGGRAGPLQDRPGLGIRQPQAPRPCGRHGEERLQEAARRCQVRMERAIGGERCATLQPLEAERSGATLAGGPAGSVVLVCIERSSWYGEGGTGVIPAYTH